MQPDSSSSSSSLNSISNSRNSSSCRILQLPLEILLEIFSLASTSSAQRSRNSFLINLATVCKKFNQISFKILLERLNFKTDLQAREYLKRLHVQSTIGDNDSEISSNSSRESSLGNLTRRLSINYKTDDVVDPELISVQEEEEEQQQHQPGGRVREEEEEAIEARFNELRNARRRAREIQNDDDENDDNDFDDDEVFVYASQEEREILQGRGRGRGRGQEAGERDGEEEEQQVVKSSNAMKIFYSLSNLKSLRVESDDEFRTLFSSLNRKGGKIAIESLLGRVGVVKLLGSKIRWDRLIQLLKESELLKELQVQGLYEAPQEEEQELEEPEREQEVTTTTTSSFSRGGYPLSLERPASPLPLAPLAIPSFPRFKHLVRLRLDSPSLSDQFLISLVGSLKNSPLESFALTNCSNCCSRQGLIIALRNLRNLFELELSNLEFVVESSSNNQTQAQQPLFSSSKNSSLKSDHEEEEEEGQVVLPLPRSFSTDQLDPYSSTVPFSENLPITLLELKNPIDYLPLYCPFLQSLKLTQSPVNGGNSPLVSKLFFEKSVLRLPLQYLTLGVTDSSRRGGGVGGGNNTRPFSKDLMVEMVGKIAGRLEALAITKEMMWEETERDWLRTTCSNFGIVYTSEKSLNPGPQFIL